MHHYVVAGWRAGIALLLCIVMASGVSTAVGHSVATPESVCPGLSGTPVAGLGTPAPDTLATPSAGTPETGGHGSAIVDVASFTDALEACGVSIESPRSVEQPFLQPESGTGLRLTGGSLSQPVDIQVYEYRDAEQAAADAAQIGPDGHPTTMMIHWIEPPHFFRSERIIVLYIGEDQAIIDLLTTLLGPPFAGS
jgi:hypothetical protein